MNTVSVLQSNYIPWKGYFDLIHDSNICIFYDDVQFTKNDWRNRNKLKSQVGSSWVTIPVGADTGRRICDVDIKDYFWQAKHWKTIQHNYSSCAFFSQYRSLFEEIYLGQFWGNLSELNQYVIQRIAVDVLGISTVFRDSREFTLSGASWTGCCNC